MPNNPYDFGGRNALVTGCGSAAGIGFAAARLLARLGVRGLYPLWLRDTARLAAEFVEQNYKAIVVAVDARVLDRTFAGRAFDQKFIDSLPAGVDPCGERGEFHTFVFDGPPFSRPVSFVLGETREDAGHFVRELLPRQSRESSV
jgi:uncharacterized protein (TIGR00290 family)